MKVFSAKIVFFTNSRKFPAIRYSSRIGLCSGDYGSMYGRVSHNLLDNYWTITQLGKAHIG